MKRKRSIGLAVSIVAGEAGDLESGSSQGTKLALQGASDPLNVSIEDDIAGRLPFEMNRGLVKGIGSASSAGVEKFSLLFMRVRSAHSVCATRNGPPNPDEAPVICFGWRLYRLCSHGLGGSLLLMAVMGCERWISLEGNLPIDRSLRSAAVCIFR